MISRTPRRRRSAATRSSISAAVTSTNGIVSASRITARTPSPAARRRLAADGLGVREVQPALDPQERDAVDGRRAGVAGDVSTYTPSSSPSVATYGFDAR